MYKTEISTDISTAVEYLKQGIPVAFPTETVYGLGSGVFNGKGIENIYKIKGRPSDNPLIVHLSDLSMLPQVAVDIPADFYKLAEAFMPGPLTVVVRKATEIPDIVTAGLSTVGIRIPSHPVAHALIKAYGSPIAAPSANLSGKPSSTKASHVLEDFNGKIPLILDGEASKVGIESTVVELHDNQAIILRPGSISKEMIKEVLKKPVILKTKLSEEIPTAPGMKYRHYAPKAPVIIFENERSIKDYLKTASASKRIVLAAEKLDVGIEWKRLAEDTFYDSLRYADSEGVAEIFLLLSEEIYTKEGLMNRIFKASGAL